MSSVLLEKIRKTNNDAARELEKAGFFTDSDIQSLTRDDLHELFPGAAKIKLRRTIFDIIHEQRPIDVLIRELKDFIPHESFRAALTNNGVLVEYLRILKDMKTQMNCVQSFLDAHIGLLEELSKSQPYQESDKGTSDNCRPAELINDRSSDRPHRSQSSSSGTSSLGISCEKVPHSDQTGGHPHGPQLKYQKIVTGKTFNADVQLMEKVKGQLQFTESNEDFQITIVFCPISSRIGTDVEAAMTTVKGDKPVILVLMHHAHEPKYTTSLRTWHENSEPKVVLHVSVFYHETFRGLLRCQQNHDAVSEIRNKLLEYSIYRSQNTSENTVLDAERGITSSSGSNVRGSDADSGSSRIGGIWNIFSK